MSITFSGSRSGPSPERPTRRVRHDVRDGFAVAVFSALSSTALAGAMLLLVRWAG
ncbi:MAG: hypothetical protein H0V42_10770 [Nocardioidaceae bacterium]|nr:hypothetical protein [Nocardioidaceae bacterium]